MVDRILEEITETILPGIVGLLFFAALIKLIWMAVW